MHIPNAATPLYVGSIHQDANVIQGQRETCNPLQHLCTHSRMNLHGLYCHDPSRRKPERNNHKTRTTRMICNASEHNEHSQGLRSLDSYLLLGEYPSRVSIRLAHEIQFCLLFADQRRDNGIMVSRKGLAMTHMALELAHI